MRTNWSPIAFAIVLGAFIFAWGLSMQTINRHVPPAVQQALRVGLPLLAIGAVLVGRWRRRGAGYRQRYLQAFLPNIQDGADAEALMQRLRQAYRRRAVWMIPLMLTGMGAVVAATAVGWLRGAGMLLGLALVMTVFIAWNLLIQRRLVATYVRAFPELCPVCGYQRGELVRCPECGASAEE